MFKLNLQQNIKLPTYIYTDSVMWLSLNVTCLYNIVRVNSLEILYNRQTMEIEEIYYKQVLIYTTKGERHVLE